MLRIPKNRNSWYNPRSISEKEGDIIEGRINGGLVTNIEDADIQNNQFVELTNVTVRNDLTSRRRGGELFIPGAPDAIDVLSINLFKRFDLSEYLIRFTYDSVHSSLIPGGAWVSYTGTLAGTNLDRFNVIAADDRLFFTNNGADYVQEIDFGTLTFARLGNAPKYKFIMSFHNRIVGAYDYGNDNPIEVGWSGDLNYGEWSSLVDPSAGSVPLIESPSGQTDPITGLFGFTEVALMLRERSIYLITKTSSATNPFAFTPVSNNIGCDTPYSAVPISDGIAWFDRRTRSVYTYTLASRETKRISAPIDNLLDFSSSVEDIFSGYNSIKDEYELHVKNPNTLIVTTYVFNFRNGAWSTRTHANLSFGNGVVDANNNYQGYMNGDILESDLADYSTDNVSSYTTTIISKTYVIPDKDYYVKKFVLEYIPCDEGNFSVYYSKDSGTTWVLWKTVTFVMADLNKRKLVNFKKNLKCSQFTWKLTSSSGLFDLISYEIKLTPSGGESRNH